MKSSLLIFALLMLFNGLSFCQDSNPVQWEFKIEKIEAQSFQIISTASIQENWYLYAQELESDLGPIPTSFKYDASDNYKLVGKTEELGAVIEAYDKLFEMNISKYKNEVSFVQKIQVQEGLASISGQVEFMTCDDNKCLPPAVVEFELNID